MSDPYLYEKLAELEERLASWETAEIAYPIAVRYQTDAGQNIPNSTPTIVNFEDVTFDPNSLVTTGAGWVFTSPADGYYRVTFALLFSSTSAWADGEATSVTLFRNGNPVSTPYRRDNNSSATNTFVPLYGADVIQLATGDTINIQVTQSSGGDLALQATASFNYICIEKIN